MRVDWVPEYAGVLPALSDTNMTVHSGVGTDDGWRFEVRGNSTDEIAAFRTSLQEHTIPINIAKVQALLPIHGNSYELTETQRGPLVLAYERGYFDTPREISLEGLANELGITQQSLLSRLRSGHRHLISETLTSP